MASAQKFKVTPLPTSGGKYGSIAGTGKMAFVKPASTPAPTTKINVGGVIMDVPAYNEPMGRMAAPSDAGFAAADSSGKGEEYVSGDTGSGFSWTWIIIALVAIVVLFFVFKKK